MKKKYSLFCFPFAGGNRYSFRALEQAFWEDWDIRVMEYPGRGDLIKMSLISDLNKLVDELYQRIIPQLNNNEFAFYGHSMGALVATLLCRKITENKLPSPQHLFITGSPGPSSIFRQKRSYHLLGKKEFWECVKKLNGFPEEIFASKQLLDFYEPILRSDFKASETFVYQSQDPLSVRFTVITGSLEEMSPEEIHCWQQESRFPIDFRVLYGDHFFIYKHVSTIARLMKSKIKSNQNF